ncbi:MAG: hypothetical protein NTX79_05170 [Candidatus Micrarchaeota archaeon]|nr:hypothetical protein [Candidatus Micrarchaeota archaeon]
MAAAQTETYRHLDKEWRTLCRMLLGGEIGGLDEYSEWLSGLDDPLFMRKSSLSGAQVVFSNGEYCSSSKAVSMGEVDFSRKFEPVSINDMKDIDSLVRAVSERAYYCGNIVIGNSRFIESSSEISDSFYVYKSVRISGCKNVAYSQWMRLSEGIFGTNEGGETKYCLRSGIVYRNQRDFEAWICGNTSDSYYSYGLEDCRDCIFCFNLIGKSHCIGNVALEREKYAGIKKKLLEELRGELVRKKTLPSLIEIVNKGKVDYSEALSAVKGLKYAKRDSDKSRLEEAFREASSIVLGKKLSGIDKYSEWLSAHTMVTRDSRSVLGRTVLQGSDYPVFRELPKNRVVTQEEALVLGEKLSAGKLLAESASLSNAVEMLQGIAYFPPERRLGTYKDLVACQWGSQSSDCYRTVVASHDKCCGYNAWPRNSEHIFGSGLVFHSEFCFKCFDGVNLRRCLEMDSSRECSDSMFCHNVENLQNSMFCFNTKNKQYAIGNASIGREEYSRVKNMVLRWIGSELEKNKEVPLSIFDIGCAGRGK